jgi:hypothetical protein
MDFAVFLCNRAGFRITRFWPPRPQINIKPDLNVRGKVVEIVLHEVLEEFERTQGPMTLDQLARRLDVERSALEGMVDYWVRKGRLRDDQQATALGATFCGGSACGIACPGPLRCPHATAGPRSFSLVKKSVKPN